MQISFANTKLYEVIVNKNSYVKNEYDNYIRINRAKGKNNRLLEWLFLFRVKIAYLILNRKSNPKSAVGRKTDAYSNIKTSESEKEKRIAPQYLIKRMLEYDVISFDVFDTLIFRPFSSPKIVFELLEAENEIDHFATLRVAVEEQVRKEKNETYGTREVSLEEIYERIERYTGIEKKKGMEAEIEKELDICFANPYMLNVFHMLQEYGKRIIITTDMYLSKETIQRILGKNGYQGYEKIYVSCEYEINKATGELYNLITDELGKTLSYIHIGDNKHSDINMARKAGWGTFYYRNVNETGKRYRADGISKLIRGAAEGIMNTHLHNGMNTYSPAYEFGYVNGGLYCLGYVNWIHKYAVQNKIDKVIFLARDGDIYKKIYDNLYTDIKSEYVYWSRISTVKCNITKNQYDFLRRLTIYPILNGTDITLEESLNSVNLQDLIESLKGYGLDKTELLSEENQRVYTEFILDNIEKIKKIYEREERCAEQYLRSVIGDSSKIAVVDVGWAGSGPLGIKHLIEQKWKWDCQVECLVAATGNEATYKLLSGKLNVYLFSKNYNRINYDFHFHPSRIKVSNDCFELLTQATYPSFCGFDVEQEKIKLNFSTAVVEGYETVREIQRGIMDFVKEYVTKFRKYDMLMNISGYDAYCAFRPALRNLNYFRYIFGEFPCEYDTGKRKRIVSLDEYFRLRIGE